MLVPAPLSCGGEDKGKFCQRATDCKAAPVRHFGLLMAWDAWEALAARFEAAGVAFVIEPYVRFKGEPGEQGTFFLRDPAGNALEFKCFRDEAGIFAR